MKKKYKIIVISIVVLFIILAIYFKLQGRHFNGDVETVQCTYVATKDGDSMVVEIDGEEVEVRLIGINTPERGTEEGEEAYKFVKEYLTKGQILFLEYDKERYDKYDRTLAYIWLNDSCDYNNIEDFKQYCLNAIILQGTNCESVYYRPNGKYKDWFETIEVIKHING